MTSERLKAEADAVPGRIRAAQTGFTEFAECIMLHAADGGDRMKMRVDIIKK